MAHFFTDRVAPYVDPALDRLDEVIPEGAQDIISGWFSPIPNRDGVGPKEMKLLRRAARHQLSQGAQAAVTLPIGDEINPRFLLASNLPDETRILARLKGKPGTLLGVPAFESEKSVVLHNHFTEVGPFLGDAGKSIPKGEYVLSVIQNGTQTDSQARDQVLLLERSFFLGGPRDAIYARKLKEFNDALAERFRQEKTESMQFLSTLSSQVQEFKEKKFTESWVNRWKKMMLQLKSALEQARQNGRSLDRCTRMLGLVDEALSWPDRARAKQPVDFRRVDSEILNLSKDVPVETIQN